MRPGRAAAAAVARDQVEAILAQDTPTPLGEPHRIAEDEYPPCPVCGDPIDYCQGHGEIAEAVSSGREGE